MANISKAKEIYKSTPSKVNPKQTTYFCMVCMLPDFTVHLIGLIQC